MEFCSGLMRGIDEEGREKETCSGAELMTMTLSSVTCRSVKHIHLFVKVDENREANKYGFEKRTRG